MSGSSKASQAHVAIIGGGGTGAALAYDLALRGIHVTLLERGELTSGTTGRHHGQLHCGARYAVQDREIGRECMRESAILRRIAPASIEFNCGLFIALSAEDEAYCDSFLPACRASGIPTRLLTATQALAMEPRLNPRIRLAVLVPDGSMDAWRLALQFFASARARGADIRNFSEVVGIESDASSSRSASRIRALRVRDYRRSEEYRLEADLVVNAGGAWAGAIARMAGLKLPVSPSPGTMVAVKGRLMNMVVSRLHPAGDGDILVPQRSLSIVGSTQWLAEDPDRIDVPHRDVEDLLRAAEAMVPDFRASAFHAAWAAARPLAGTVAGSEELRSLSRDFSLIDHGKSDGLDRFLSIVGGKATTLRRMAEITADRVCSRLGIETACRTEEEPLLPARSFYSRRAGAA